MSHSRNIHSNCFDNLVTSDMASASTIQDKELQLESSAMYGLTMPDGYGAGVASVA